jgi:hypothetical protein
MIQKIPKPLSSPFSKGEERISPPFGIFSLPKAAKGRRGGISKKLR